MFAGLEVRLEERHRVPNDFLRQFRTRTLLQVESQQSFLMTYTSEKMRVPPSILNKTSGVKKKEIPEEISGVASVKRRGVTTPWKCLTFLEFVGCV